jgi:signal transduction histidine kinase
MAARAGTSLTNQNDLDGPLLANQERERSRIAADLDASIGSALILAKFRMEDAIRRARTNAPRAATQKRVEEIVSQVTRALQETRRIARWLRSSILDDLGVIAAITCFVRELNAGDESARVVHRIDVQEKDIPKSCKTAIYRIMQEAARNAIKHSGADAICVSLRADANMIQLAVEDHGVGINMWKVIEESDRSQGFGIASMHQLAKCSGGSLTISAETGAGTKVVASWPMSSRD